MIFILESNDLKNIFGVEEYNELIEVIDSLAPSLLEYHFESLLSYSSEAINFNRFNIEHTLDLSKFKLYLDYDKKYYLEKSSIENDFESTSLF